MCGRFTQHHSPEQVAIEFNAETVFAPGPRYNIAPKQTIAVVVTEAKSNTRMVDGFSWGLVPFWADDPDSVGAKMINARSETAGEKPSFRNLLTRRRCIIPADGFYEWDKVSGAKVKQPYHFRRSDGALMGFAGLWDEWRPKHNAQAARRANASADDADDEADDPDDAGLPLLLRTCTILTTQANALVGRIHDRMPVILQAGENGINPWLDPNVTDKAALLALLHAYPDALMEAVPVSRRVNAPVADDPDLIALATVNSA